MKWYSPQNKDELLACIHEARAALEQVIERLSERQLSEPRDANGWAVKDHLMNLALWEGSMVYLLRKRPRHEGLGVDETSYLSLDADGINAIMFEQHKHRPAAEVLTAFRDVHQDMLNTLATLSWDDLRRTYSHYQPDEPGEDSGEPILRWVIGNTAVHFDEHREWIEGILRNA